MAGNFYAVSPYIVNQSLGAGFTSSEFRIGEFDHISIQVDVTNASGGLNGTLQLQQSVDGLTFSNLGSGTTLNANTTVLTPIQDVYTGFIRFVYTRVGGNGTLNVKIGTVSHK